MSKQHVFESVNSIDDFKKIIVNDNDNINYLYRNYVNDENIILSIMCLNSLKRDNDKEEEFVKFIHYVDKKMNFPKEAHQTRRHKIPTLFASAIYFDKYYDNFSIYTEQEKMIIAKYSALESIDFYENINHLFSKKVMDTVILKNNDWSYQEEFLDIVLKYINSKSEDEIISYLLEHNDNELLKENSMSFDRIVEEMGDYNL